MKLEHVLSVKQFDDTKFLDRLFKRAGELQAMSPHDYPKPLKDLTLATIFYEPSTRTRLSFETAIQNLGGNLISTENAGEFSSHAKGESLEDTIRTINAYADGIIVRHPETGAAKRAGAVSKVPIINAGDGPADHPTQALLDAYTIKQAKGSLDGLTLAMVGDLLYGRTVHSLLQLASLYDLKEVLLISPPSLELPTEYLDDLDAKGITYTILHDWKGALEDIDVLYMTRVQRERFTLIEDYNKVKDDFIITPAIVQQMKSDAIIMHPLPRVNEIEPEVDADPRAYYFEQVKNGLFIRMALLEHLYSP